MDANLSILAGLPDCEVRSDITDRRYRFEPAGILRWRVKNKAVGHESAARILEKRGLPLEIPRPIQPHYKPDRLESEYFPFGGDDHGNEEEYFDHDYEFRQSLRDLSRATDTELRREMGDDSPPWAQDFDDRDIDGAWAWWGSPRGQMSDEDDYRLRD